MACTKASVRRFVRRLDRITEKWLAIPYDKLTREEGARRVGALSRGPLTRAWNDIMAAGCKKAVDAYLSRRLRLAFMRHMRKLSVKR